MWTRRCLAALGLFALAAAAAQAHTLRVIATRPGVSPGGKTTVYLSWGHLLPVDELVRAGDLASYQLHTPDGSVTPLKTDEFSLQAHSLALPEPGVYQVAALRTPTVFYTYADASGKTVFVPKGKDEVDLPEGATLKLSGRSQQCAKALVVCGKPAAGVAVEPLGHPLEIVPEAAPGAQGYPIDDPVRVRVLFGGKPLAGATVLAVSPSLNPDGVPEDSIETDADGYASLRLAEPGTWSLEVHHDAEAPDDQRHRFDRETYTATLSIAVAEPN